MRFERYASDLDRDPLFFRLTKKAPVEIEATRVGIELDRRAGLGGLLDDRCHIHGVRIQGEQPTSGWMPEDRQTRILEGARDTSRHRLFTHLELRVH